MVDAERLHRVLRRVTDDLVTLRGYAAMDPGEMLGDPARLGHVKYCFVTAIEGCIDAAQHVCASEGFDLPATNADAMQVLARHNVFDTELAERLAAAVRFRNLLVHGYATIDDRRVVEFLANLDDLEAFVDTLSSLVGDDH